MTAAKNTNCLLQLPALFAAITVVLVLAVGGIVFAGEYVCKGTVGAITVDNLVVPSGKTCTLNGTNIQGNLFVYTGATLSASAVNVEGNIQAEGARAVYVNPSSVVGGSIQIKQGQTAKIDRVTIDGDLQLFQNTKAVTSKKAKVGGNLQVFGNRGGVKLLNNMIAENLQCKENNPAPTGGGNIAGNKEDQCSGL